MAETLERIYGGEPMQENKENHRFNKGHNDMKTEQEQSNRQISGHTVFLVNIADNPDAHISESSFSDKWSWIQAPAHWKPQDGIKEDTAAFDAIIVFSTKYKEQDIRELCEAIREIQSLKTIPLLVAVNQYEMPLANRVKELPHADFIFTPVRQEELVDRLHEMDK